MAAGAEVRGDWIGARVTVPFCRLGRARRGRRGDAAATSTTSRGSGAAVAHYVALPRADLNLVRLPEALVSSRPPRSVPLHDGVRGRDCPRAAGRGDWVAVHGWGRGLAAVMIAVAAGARSRPSTSTPRSSSARELGAEATVDARDGDAAAAVLEATAGGAQVSTRSAAPPPRCVVGSLRKHGRHVQVGLMLGDERSWRSR